MVLPERCLRDRPSCEGKFFPVLGSNMTHTAVTSSCERYRASNRFLALGGIVSQRSDVQQAPQRRVRRRKRSRKRAVLVGVILVVVVIMVVAVEGGRSRPGPPLPASLPENLKLSGAINGQFTTATAIQGLSSNYPTDHGAGFGPIDATACVQNSGEGWEVDLYGRVGKNEMSLTFDGQDEYGNNMAADYVGKHDIDNNANTGGLASLYWGSQDLEFPMPGSATLVVNRNGASGTMDIQFASGPQGGTTVETIKGSWRCV
jgi:hypothetical protein